MPEDYKTGGGLPASSRRTNGHVIECRDRIGFRPQTDPAGLEPGVPGPQQERAVEPSLHAPADRHRSHRVPATERRCSDAGVRDLASPAIVVVHTEVAFEGVGPDDEVLPGILFPRSRTPAFLR